MVRIKITNVSMLQSSLVWPDGCYFSSYSEDLSKQTPELAAPGEAHSPQCIQASASTFLIISALFSEVPCPNHITDQMLLIVYSLSLWHYEYFTLADLYLYTQNILSSKLCLCVRVCSENFMGD